MVAAGLAASAALGSVEQTMPALVGVVMSALVISGALVEIAGRPIIGQLAWLSPSRWAYAAMASSTALQRPVRTQRGELDWSAQHGGFHWAIDVFMLALTAVGFVLLAAAFTRRSARGSR